MASNPEGEGGKPSAPAAPGRRRITKTGVVRSAKMQKTVVVTVDAVKAHPTYGRTLRRSNSFLAHDPEGRCAAGDRVVIAESRPLSRSKRWRVVEILEKGGVEAAGPAAPASGTEQGA